MCSFTNGLDEAAAIKMTSNNRQNPGEDKLQENATRIRDLTKLINEPQSLPLNVEHLKAAGGVKALLELLGTDPDAGVSDDSVAKRRELFGSNTLPSTPRKSFWQLFIDTFDDGTL